MDILKDDKMKEDFYKVIRREYENMGWAQNIKGEPSGYTEEGYPEYLITNVYEPELKAGADIVDIIIGEIKENEIVMNAVRQDEPERAKYIQNFINELKAILA